MRIFLKIISYIFHPIFIPFFGCILYFTFSSRFFPRPLIDAKLLAIAIITVFIPIVFFFLLRTLGLAGNIFLEKAKERILPLLLYIVLLYLLVLKIIFDEVDFPELHYFFLGVLFSSMTSLILAFLNLKISLHMVGISGLTMFLIALSIYFKVNLLDTLAFLIVANGLVASSRLESKSHSIPELIIGVFIGIIPQLLMLQYWL